MTFHSKFDFDTYSAALNIDLVPRTSRISAMSLSLADAVNVLHRLPKLLTYLINLKKVTLIGKQALQSVFQAISACER